MVMISKEPKEMKVEKIKNFLLGGVAPRPIALVSTISPDGIPNLAPFSFFNAFGANPPMIAFSASRRVRDNTTKHTLTNIEATGECVVQAVTYDMVQQVSLAFFYGLLVNVLVICEHDVGINGKAKHVLPA